MKNVKLKKDLCQKGWRRQAAVKDHSLIDEDTYACIQQNLSDTSANATR